MMKTSTAAVFLVLLLCSDRASAVVTFDWATVGNPGNAPDTEVMVTDGTTGYGGVDYAYRISKHEVTNAQYTEFLNAVDPTGANSLAIYNSNMSTDAFGGINFNSGAANGVKYEIKSGRDNNPVVYVSFFDAMRFVNWLENGQGSGGTESGVYTIGFGTDEVRDPNATYFIPSEDEWYKAAYYDPTDVYYDYPTGTDTVPYSDNPASLNTPDDTNVANFLKGDNVANGYDDGYAVTGSSNFVNTQNYLTDVGAYSLVTSPYGTFDQGGNVWEWNEAVISYFNFSYRGLRGGSWIDSSLGLRADDRVYVNPTDEDPVIGFRVASIPEPSTVLMGALATVGFLMWRRW